MTKPLRSALLVKSPGDAADGTIAYELKGVDQNFIDKLCRVSTAADLTKGQAIAAGIDLLERLVEADKQGKEFALVPKTNQSHD